MSDRSKRETAAAVAAAVKPKAPWAAMLLAVPALIAALQSYSESQDAKNAASKVGESGYARDDSTWRYTRMILDQQSVQISECRLRSNQMADSIQKLQKEVFSEQNRPKAEGFRYPPGDKPALPEGLDGVLRKGM